MSNLIKNDSITTKALKMIARAWNGKVLKAHSTVYHQYLLHTGVTDYKKLKGNLGVQLMCRYDEEHTYFTVTTYWESVEHIKLYVGDDIDQAKYYPEDEKYLIDIQYTLHHYDVLYSENSKQLSIA